MGIVYELILFLHVVSAIGSVGPLFVLLVIVRLMKRNPEMDQIAAL